LTKELGRIYEFTIEEVLEMKENLNKPGRMKGNLENELETAGGEAYVQACRYPCRRCGDSLSSCCSSNAVAQL